MRCRLAAGEVMCVADVYVFSDVYVCVCVYIYIYIYIYTHLRDLCLLTARCLCVRSTLSCRLAAGEATCVADVYVCVYIYMCVYMYIYIYIYICMYVCMAKPCV